LDPCPRDWTWPSRPAWSQGRDAWTVACAGGDVWQLHRYTGLRWNWQ
jgi:hypothetical protein